MDSIPWVTVGLIWIVNFAISWWNARAVGLVWVETKQIGGWQRFMTWMGTIMSASGFTWCFLIVLLFGAYYEQWHFLKAGAAAVITENGVVAGLNLGYLIIIPGVLFSGMMIWIDSVVEAWKRRDLPSMGIAGWNTYAQYHNMHEAFSGIGGAFDSVSNFFDTGDSDDDTDITRIGVVIVVGLVLLAVAGGIMTTWALVRHYAGSRPLPDNVRQGIRNSPGGMWQRPV